ncbi:MAG TPA: tyrosine-type recombinase/integrase [Nitrososphaeraceae archaeon]|nr:tyrosine-type recombinase/integrase [Nitrososphaeraceae archaeon]
MLSKSMRGKITKYDRSRTFLDTVGKNSRKTRSNYETALVHLESFLSNRYDGKYNVDSIIDLISRNQMNVYELLDGFVSFECIKGSQEKNMPQSIKTHTAGIKSYFAYYDIDIIPSKFKRKVKMPKTLYEKEEPLDAADIRKILLACNNRRLKTYLLILASGGLRAVEACAIRVKDIDFKIKPTMIHIRAEYAKTRVGRDIYISDEATQYLKQWLDWKYRERSTNPDDLVFNTFRVRSKPEILYGKIATEFTKVLKVAGLDERKEGMRRRMITLHSLRRFVKTVLSDEVGGDYSEWFLGHNGSVYYTKKESERREIYLTKCMKYLTFLDYTAVEARGKSIEAKLSEKDIEMRAIKEKYEQDLQTMREETNQRFNQIMSMIQHNPKLAQVKPESLMNKRI